MPLWVEGPCQIRKVAHFGTLITVMDYLKSQQSLACLVPQSWVSPSEMNGCGLKGIIWNVHSISIHETKNQMQPRLTVEAR